MDAVLIFGCLFLPSVAINYLSSSRDILLFQTHPRTRRSAMLAFMAAGVAGLLWLGFPTSWALALVLPGPMGAGLGDWLANGGPLVLRYRLFGR